MGFYRGNLCYDDSGVCERCLVACTPAEFLSQNPPILGPGIARDQMKKIFTLFYRPENELPRDIRGAGISLALVNQLTLTMNGRVDVVNRELGAEFEVEFRVLKIESGPGI